MPPPPPSTAGSRAAAPAVPAAEHALPHARRRRVRRDQAPPPPAVLLRLRPPSLRPRCAVPPAAAAAAAPVAAHPETVAPPLDPLPRRGERRLPRRPSQPGPVTPRDTGIGDRTSPPAARCSTTRLGPRHDAAAVGQSALGADRAAPRRRRPARRLRHPDASDAAAGADAADVARRRRRTSARCTRRRSSRHRRRRTSTPSARRSCAASRQQRRGKMFSRTMLALFLIGGLMAAALVFGRAYLFPTEWDQSLTPIVDDIQNERGVEFDHTVGLVKQPSADYALTIGRLVVDDGWLGQVPVWRALGLTTGEPTVDGIAPALAAATPGGVRPRRRPHLHVSRRLSGGRRPDLRLALEQAYAAQQGNAAEPYPTTSRTPDSSVSRRRSRSSTRRSTAYIAERDTDMHRRDERLPRGVAIETGPRRRCRSPSSTSPARSTISARRCCRRQVSTQRPCGSGRPTPTTSAPARRRRPPDGERCAPGRRPFAGAADLRWASTTGRWCGARDCRRRPSTSWPRSSSPNSFRPIDRGGLTCCDRRVRDRQPHRCGTVLAAMQTWAAAAPGRRAGSTVTNLPKRGSSSRVRSREPRPQPCRRRATSTPSSTAS